MSNYEQPTFPPQGWRPGDGTPAKPVTEQTVCRLCETMVRGRRETIAALRDRIAWLEGEIAEIQAGDRHHTSHHRYMTPD